MLSECREKKNIESTGGGKGSLFVDFRLPVLLRPSFFCYSVPRWGDLCQDEVMMFDELVCDSAT